MGKEGGESPGTRAAKEEANTINIEKVAATADGAISAAIGNDGEVYTVLKGGNKTIGGKGGKAGYGECWHCGGWGHAPSGGVPKIVGKQRRGQCRGTKRR